VKSITGAEPCGLYNYSIKNQKYGRLGGQHQMTKLFTKLAFAIVSGVFVAAVAAQAMQLLHL
jgi:hypothetical protein